jgi:hypothetical protein
MKLPDSHLTDQDLLLDLEGEISSRQAKAARVHLESCWTCRTRRRELEDAIADFVRFNQQETCVPTAAGPRALLKARLAQLSATSETHPRSFPITGVMAALAASACVLLAVILFQVRSNLRPRSASHAALIVSLPDSKLTPGATVLVSRGQVCSQPNPNNRMVPVALQRLVFDEYGIPGADPRAYEVDYLVTPALGGADDIRNLWPHSYSATVWNAHVKDALEDRMRTMVCAGTLDLAAAQQEIATNWIAAYKKYFHTDAPLADHLQ